MKKIIVFTLILTLLLLLTSCNTNKVDGCDFINHDNGKQALILGGFEEIIIPENVDGKPVTTVVSKEIHDSTMGFLKLLLAGGIIGEISNLLEKPIASFSDVLSLVLSQVTTDMTVKKIYIPKTVESIHEYTFDNFGALEYIEVDEENPYYKSVDGILYSKDGKTLVRYPMGRKGESFAIPDGVTAIEANAFLVNKNYRVDINDKDNIIDENTNYALKSIIIPDSVRTIGTMAFYGSAIEEINIPNGVKRISASAFCSCSKLKKVTLGENVFSIGNSAFAHCTSLEIIVMPEVLETIGESAFWRCSSIKEIYIPNSVTDIGNAAFRGCTSLKKVYIPDSLKTLSASVFYGCNSLDRFEISSGLRVLAIDTFSNMGLTCLKENGNVYYGTKDNPYFILLEANTSNSTYVLNGKTSVISANAFVNYSSLEEIVLSGESENFKVVDGVLYTKDGKTLVKYPTGRKNEIFSIPIDVTTIGPYAFAVGEESTSYLKRIVIPDSVTLIDAYAFSNNSLVNVSLPKNLTSIGCGAFSGCKSLVSVVPRGNSLKTIGEYAFSNCTALYSFNVPNGVEEIMDYAFSGCASLTSTTIPSSLKYLGAGVFDDTDMHYYLYDNGYYLGNTKNPYHVLVVTQKSDSFTTHDDTVVIASESIQNHKTVCITNSVQYINDKAISKDTRTIKYVGSMVAWRAMEIDYDALYFDHEVLVVCLDGTIYAEKKYTGYGFTLDWENILYLLTN